MSETSVAIVGAGPSGLMAAQTLLAAGCRVDIYDAMPSVGRKFLLAGRGGLNLTHSEASDRFLSRYGSRQAQVAKWLGQFDAEALRQWAHDLGIETFVGSSGRVFPREMKAAPLLRAWLHRLREMGLRVHVRHVWRGWSEQDDLLFDSPQGQVTARPDATVLAMGGASWPRLGSDGAWQLLLEQKGVKTAPFLPSNCGFECGWSEHFIERYAGQPLKSVALAQELEGSDAEPVFRRGECMLTEQGLEGGAVYALSAGLRDDILAKGRATLLLDLLPDRSLDFVREQVAWPRGSRSMSSHLQSRLGIKGVKAGLLRECVSASDFRNPEALARAIKRLPIVLLAMRPIEEAISTAGGVGFDALDERQMLRVMPSVFCAGEMLDWEAPTGGYLLTACFASGVAAGRGVLEWLAANKPERRVEANRQ